jgi:hypothetical protein
MERYSPTKSSTGSMLQKYKDMNKGYQDAYNQIDDAQDKINLRLQRLNNEKDNMRNATSRFASNPNLYQFTEPMYYPLDAPMRGEPVSMPKIEMGQPISTDPNKSLGMNDLQALIEALGMKKAGEEKEVKKPLDEEIKDALPYDKKEEEKKQPPAKKKPIAPIPKDQNKVKKDWWKVARAFVNLHKFYSTATKYGRHAQIRNKVIGDLSKEVYSHIDNIKSWVIAIERLFWEEFKVFKDLDLTMSSNMGELKLKENAQKITVLLKTFFKNLIQKTNNGNDIPEKIQQIMYNYIRDKAYFPQKYLSTFEINRLDFNLYGGTKNMTDTQMGMLLAFLVISRTSVQQILLHPLENFDDFRGYPKLPQSCKFLGSILHYITRDAFSNSPAMQKDTYAHLNYYRNYHIHNSSLEAGNNGYSSTFSPKDQDELCQNLNSTSQVQEYWKHAPDDIKILRSWIYSWAINVAKFIRTKYRKFDKNSVNKNSTTKSFGIS